jgi:hypothetical protein
MVQAVKHLLCKHKALSSNPYPTKKKKERLCAHKSHFYKELITRIYRELQKLNSPKINEPI